MAFHLYVFAYAFLVESNLYSPVHMKYKYKAFLRYKLNKILNYVNLIIPIDTCEFDCERLILNYLEKISHM